MALIKCSECGNEISTKAPACPKCGAKIKRVGFFGFIFRTVVGLFLFIMALAFIDISTNPPTTPSAPTEAPVKSSAEQSADKENSVRYVAVRSAMAAIQSDLRNPSSVQWDKAYVNKDASIICVQYRGQNGFGGMSRELVVIYPGHVSQSGAVWNKKCTRNMFDMSYVLSLND